MDDIINLTDRESFAFWTEVTIRYCDQDELGHINNCTYPEYIEIGRIAFLGGLLSPERHQGIDFILARIVINFRNEAHFPGIMKVGSRILKLGKKSMTTGYGLFLNGECKATTECVNIYFMPKTRETILIPEDIRELLEADPLQRTRGVCGNKSTDGKTNR